MPSVILSICDKINVKKKRGAYRNYTRLIKKFIKNGIWKALSKKISLEEIYALHVSYKIPKSTIRSWNNALMIDNSWLLNHTRRFFFPRDVENVIAELIMELYDSRNLPISNTTVKKIAKSYYEYIQSVYNPEEKVSLGIPSHFSATPKWLNDFKKRYRFSRRKFHYKRRPEINQEKVDSFFKKMKFIFETFPPERILNVDETFWRLMDSGTYTWAPKGSSNIYIKTTGSEKSDFTSVATIGADGATFPLVMIASGTTTRVEQSWFGAGRSILAPKFEPVPVENPQYCKTSSRRSSEKFFLPSSLTDHSSSGWTTTETWLNFLLCIRFNWFPIEEGPFYCFKNTIVLIADSYSVHFSKAAQRLASLLNINLVQIPEGLTDLLQPLDNLIFGTVKSRSRAYMNTRFTDEIMKNFDGKTGEFTGDIPPESPLSKIEAAAVLEKNWYGLNTDLILTAWEEAIKKKTEEIEVSEKEMMDFKNHLKETFENVFNEVISKVPSMNIQEIKSYILGEKQKLEVMQTERK